MKHKADWSQTLRTLERVIGACLDIRAQIESEAQAEPQDRADGVGYMLRDAEDILSNIIVTQADLDRLQRQYEDAWRSPAVR